MSRSACTRLVALSFATFLLFVPESRAGFGLGSPTDLKPEPGDVLLVDARALTAELELDGQLVVVEDFAMSELTEHFSPEELEGATLRLIDVKVDFVKGGAARTTHHTTVKLQIALDCNRFAGRIVPAALADPNADGVVDPPALRAWLEHAGCE